MINGTTLTSEQIDYHNKIMQEGRDSYNEGKTAFECPYDKFVDCMESMIWAMGWAQAWECKNVT